MEAIIPPIKSVLKSLLRADFTTQWRNRRGVILVIAVPLVILLSWKDIIDKIGGPFALSSCITIGLMSIGLMGYSNAIARDRDKGVFQRLRVAPIPSWTIMVSRLLIQLAMISIVTIGVFLVGYFGDHISISTSGYLLAFLAAIFGGAVYLCIGQTIVGLITNPETVNSTTRLVYFIFIMVGMLGEFGVLGEQLGHVIHWSPYGTVKTVLFGALQPDKWSNDTTYALLVSLGYILIFATVGIKNFKWNTR